MGIPYYYAIGFSQNYCPPWRKAKTVYTKNCQYFKSVCQPQYWAGINSLKHFVLRSFAIISFCKMYCHLHSTRKNGFSREIPSDMGNMEPVSSIRQLWDAYHPLTFWITKLPDVRWYFITDFITAAQYLLFAWIGNVKNGPLLSLCSYKQYGIVQQEEFLG